MRETGSPQGIQGILSPESPPHLLPPHSLHPSPLSGVPVALQGEEEQRVNSRALALLRESVRK